MTKDQEARKARRREFLKLAGLGTVASAAAAAVATRSAEAAELEVEPARGYRETEHVRKAYETARF